MFILSRSVKNTFIVIMVILILVTTLPIAIFVKNESDRETDLALTTLNNALELQTNYMTRWFDLNIMEDIKAASKLRSVQSLDLDAMAEDLKAMAEDRTDLAKLLYFDRDGNPVLDSENGDISEEQFNISDREYFKAGQEGLPYITSVIQAKDEKSVKFIGFSVPLIIDGIFEGVILGSVRLSNLINLTKDHIFGEGGSFRLFDYNGVPLGENFSEATPCFSPDEVKDEEGLLIDNTSDSGKKQMLKIAPLAHGNLFVGVVLDMDEIKAGSSRIAKTHIKILISSVVLGMIFFLLLSRSVTISIDKIQRQLSSASEMNYAPTPIPPSGMPLELKRIWESVEYLKDQVCKSIQEVREMSVRDALTGLHNRRYFEEEMSRLSHGDQDPVAIAMCDVNGLKLVNDALGHEWGDKLINKAATALKDVSQPGDTVARLGGDEFALLVPNSPEERDIGADLKASMATVNLDEGIPLQMAWGIAIGNASRRSIEEIAKDADDSMYARKETQRDDARDAILTFFLRMISTREGRKVGHMERCRYIMAAFVPTIDEVDEIFRKRMIRLAGIHDIGLVGVNPSILGNTGPLSEDEKKEVRAHPEIGYRIAIAAPTLSDLADAILHHHQRWDGTGYPFRKDAVSGKGIPLESRIMNLVDSYEAMTHRYYGKSMTHEEAMEEIRRCSGTQFDPEWADRFLAFLKEKGPGVL
ncbi:diguanylate cyclase [Dethiosulfovibrio sp. F2B]|uniref:diguanylate cyclase domain-containing protein n=1 Tax=Dethiosulfovibrio faecalis TaxID=2720018 RepID=UPI001F43710A|nr:diguanylate cyclase [Dethiosulfovibrio faecalis]MCF4150874.1 diguanylate cyclase [Dethiosulfovibrio faecalis]